MFTFRKIKIRRRKREEDIVEFIERETGYSIPTDVRTRILDELTVALALNGEVSHEYINNLIKAYAYAAKEKEAAACRAGNAAIAS